MARARDVLKVLELCDKSLPLGHTVLPPSHCSGYLSIRSVGMHAKGCPGLCRVPSCITGRGERRPSQSRAVQLHSTRCTCSIACILR